MPCPGGERQRTLAPLAARVNQRSANVEVVCLSVRMSVRVSCIVWCWQVERKDKASKEGKSSPSTSKKSEVCVCVCAHARVCLCGCCLVITTWLPTTPPPQLKPVPHPHTLSPGTQSSRSSSAPARQTPVAEAPPLLDLEASDAPQAAPLSQMPLTTSAPSSNLSLLDDPTPPTTVVSGEVCLFRPLAAHAIIRRRQRLKQLS